MKVMFPGDLPPDEYQKFKKMFWVWFDNLPVDEKERFWYHQFNDAAEMEFFFRHYKTRV